MIQRQDNTFSLEQKQGSFNRNVNKYLLGVGLDLDDDYKVLVNNNLPLLFEEFEDFVNGVNRI